MEFKTLVIGQFVLDLIILGILILLGRLHLNRKAVAADFNRAMERSMSLIKEMESLGESLQGILEEKREITRKLIEDLDARLQRAQVIRDEIKSVMDKSRGSLGSGRTHERMSVTGELIEKLMAKGLSKEEVARRLGLTTGELELIMKLKGPGKKKREGES